jgi:hypothetical protein
MSRITGSSSAVEGTAEVIIPRDKTMMAIGEYEGIRLITLAD